MGTPNSFMEGDGSVIVWFRQDLRIHDNEALTEAISTGKPVIPVYVFDSRNYKDSRFDGFPKTGPIRMKFMIESVIDLRRNLRKIGLPLVVRTGLSEEIIFELGRNNKAHYIFCNRERTKDQVLIQDAVEQNLWRGGMELRYSRGKMLYYTADLPFPVTHTPDNFLVFRKEVENLVKIRKPIPSPEKQMNNLRQILDEGSIPVLEELGFRQKDVLMEPTKIEGGETKALESLKLYMDTSAGQQGFEMPALSPYLSAGCISPKYVYWSYYGESGHWDHPDLEKDLYVKLLKRDHYRLMAKKYTDRIFLRQGIQNSENIAIPQDMALFFDWINGRTGFAGIDAHMNKLRMTGYLDYAARIICARFLVEVLKLDWTIGAAYFESVLIDYDPSSNWVQWMNIGQVGIERFDHRSVNFDQLQIVNDSAYMDKWLPDQTEINP